jgi:hypothetical protein
MLKNKHIDVNITIRNISHFRKLGYNPILDKLLPILVTDLSSGSHAKVVAVCEICSNETTLIYYKYLQNRNRHGFYGCRKCSRQKAALTSLELYGEVNYMCTEEGKKKVEDSNMIKYGVKTTLLEPITNEKRKKTMIERYGSEYTYTSDILLDKVRSTLLEKYGEESYSQTKYFRKGIEYIPTEEEIIKHQTASDLEKISIENPIIKKEYDESLVKVEPLRLYRREVSRYTYKNIKIFLETWDGTDYYGGEYIKDNFELHYKDRLYPSIDHKTSVYYGFTNKIDPSIISEVSNLCMTKRCINSSKSSQSEEEFLNKLKNN